MTLRERPATRPPRARFAADGPSDGPVDRAAAIVAAVGMLQTFHERSHRLWSAGMHGKLGLTESDEVTETLVSDLLALLHCWPVVRKAMVGGPAAVVPVPLPCARPARPASEEAGRANPSQADYLYQQVTALLLLMAS